MAQSPDEAEDNGFLLNLIETQLSAPGRQIRVSGVSGALSSSASIARITLSDDTGVWLEVEDARIEWNRLALLRGRVSVDSLSASRIAWLRRAVPPEDPAVRLPDAEATPFSLPELPVSIRVDALQLDSVAFAQEVFGEAAELAVTGALTLEGGALDTEIAVRRLDAPGGELTLAAAFSNATRALDLDLRLQEPEAGLVATLLDIEGRPAIDLRLSGAGPLDEVDIDFALDAAGSRIAGGTVALRAGEAGLGFDADLGGELAPLIPAQYRDFFAGRSAIEVVGVVKDEGGLRLDTLAVQSAALQLTGALETGPDNFPRSFDLAGSLGDPDGPAVLLPVPGGVTRLQSAQIDVTFGDADRWEGRVALDRLVAGDIKVEEVTLTLGGLAQNLDDPAARTVTINLEGLATGVSAADPNVAAALGTRIDLFADAALPPGGAVDIRQLQLSGNGLSIFTAGSFADLVYTGRSAIRAADVAPFSGLAGRTLGGGLNLHATGSVTPLSGGFDLALDGAATDLALDDPRLDALLAGETALAGRVVRDETGIRTEGLRLGNAQLSFASDGRISSAATDIGFDARLADLALIDPRASGTLTASGRAQGQGGPIEVTVEAAIPQGALLGRALADARLGFAGAVAGADVTGSLEGAGSLDDQPITLEGDIAVAEARRSVTGLQLTVGPDSVVGDLTQDGAGLILGNVTLEAPDIAPLAALALIEATGAVDAEVRLQPDALGQGITVVAAARDLATAGTRVGALDADVRVVDAFGVPLAEGTIEGRDLVAAGLEVTTLSATARQAEQDRMRVVADVALAIGTQADVVAELARLPDGFAATLEALSLRQQGLAARLTAPSTITFQGAAITLTPLALDLGTGSLTAEGRITDAFDLRLDIAALPLDLADAVRPDLGLGGEINGAARVTGARDAPDIRFDLAATEVVAAATAAAGLPPLTVDATGATEAGRLNLDASVASGDGLAAEVNGWVPLGDGELDLAIDIAALPLALADQLAGGRGLGGAAAGQGRVTGPLNDPRAEFELTGSGISADALRDNGVAPLDAALSGSYADMTLAIASARLDSADGVTLTASGLVPLSGPGLDVGVSGAVPLGLANAALAQRDAQASGTVQIDARVTGALAAPQFGGAVSLGGGALVDPQTNFRLDDITLDGRLDGSSFVLDGFSANAAAGGGVSAAGLVSIDAAQGFPADLDITLDDLRYTDGAFVSTRVSGALSVAGPLLGDGQISGEIDLGATEISVSEGLGANAQATLDQVIHQLPPRRVQVTLDRARVDEITPRAEAGGPGGLGVNILIRAPRQIFVRGRGLDVELGGELRVQGRTNDLQPVGQFDLRRGRLAVLGQRIEFDEGALQLVGDLDPQVFFVARTESDDVTAIITVQGRVSELDIVFSSEPQLPQDEVLARIIFNRSADELSAFQLAQLAAAAAELAGAGGNGLLSQLRGAAGLDDLDIITEEDGSTALRAGRYISDNVYLDVQTGSDGTSRAQVNLDITRSVTARGSVGTDGNTTLGVFYERDY